MFGWELPPFNSGGLGVACYGLTQALADLGVEITFVLPKKVKVNIPFMKVIFADVLSPETFVSPYISLPPEYNQLPPELYSAVIAYAKAAVRIAKKEHFDLVHAHDWLCFPAGLAASETSSKPLVTHVHATEFDRSGGLSANPSVYAIEKKGLTKSSKVIAVSNFTKNIISKMYGTPSSKVEVVHNGINSQEYESPAQSDLLSPLKAAGFKVVTYVGRLTLQKGVDYFIQSAKQVISFNSKVVFLIVGSGDMENQLIRQVAECGISDHVLFAGFLRGNLLKNVFQSSDLFVMPSVSEPFGLTALEAVASGTPALISKQSGVSETLTHALKIDFWDVNEMTNQILAVVNYPSLHKALKINSGKEVKSVTWSKAAATTIKVYKEVLGRK
jgi:glycosyltransferase involved in cell wall biosynthesis